MMANLSMKFQALPPHPQHIAHGDSVPTLFRGTGVIAFVLGRQKSLKLRGKDFGKEMASRTE